MKRKLLITILLSMCFEVQAAGLETGNLFLGQKKISVEIADDEQEREKGLMFRTELEEGEGMLFVFESERPLSFWMKNTFIPLSIGYFNAQKKLIDIQDMQPVKTEMLASVPSYPSRGPAKFALEVPKGWFQKHNIRLGTTFRLEKRASGGR